MSRSKPQIGSWTSHHVLRTSHDGVLYAWNPKKLSHRGAPALHGAAGPVTHAGGLPRGRPINLGVQKSCLYLNLCSHSALNGARRGSSDVVRRFITELCFFFPQIINFGCFFFFKSRQSDLTSSHHAQSLPNVHLQIRIPQERFGATRMWKNSPRSVPGMKEGQNKIALCKQIGQMQKKQACLLREDREQQAYSWESRGLTPEAQSNWRPLQWQGLLLFNFLLFSVLQPIAFCQKPQRSSVGGQTVGEFQFFTWLHSWEGAEGVCI